jgi:LL-diaminopimelate aminotransferase
MIIRASDRVSGIGSYAFAEIDKEVSRLEKQGIEVIDFGVGDPRSPTSDIVRSSCQESIDRNKSSGYPSYIGTEEFRQTVVDWMEKRFSVSLDCEKEVTATIGAKEAVFNFQEGFINPGDFVLMPNPGYPPYERGTLFAEGEPYFLNLLAQDDFLVNLDKIPEEIVKKARILWINYPNNPTTVMADKDWSWIERGLSFFRACPKEVL